MDTPNRWTDPDTDNRYYNDGKKEPSVTTILKLRDQDTSGLDNWRSQNDGVGTNPKWQHLFWYKRHRGTLCHWHALSTIDPLLEYGDDERQSRFELYHQNEDEVADDSPREVLYSVLKDRGTIENYADFYALYEPYHNSTYYREAIWSLIDEDIEYFVTEFESIWDALGGPDTVAVERYLLDHEYGFGGQADLVIKHTNGDVAICDLKTSSSNRDKNKIQAAAYAKAVENDDSIPVDAVDRTEVWRIHPDSGSFTLHSNERYGPLYSDSYWNESIEESWNTFADLCEQFHTEIDVEAVEEPDH